MKKEKIIIDGDWGGDEMQLATVLLADTEQIEILGATCTFGNVSHDKVYENARRILYFLNAAQIPLFKGAHAPTKRNEPLTGDGAHPVIEFLNKSPNETEQDIKAVDFIIDTLKKEQNGTVSITASGPLTNIANAIQQEPDLMKKVKQIVIMGGCTEKMVAYDTESGKRQGNITEYAEFNFQQAAFDAKVVMESGLPIVLFPMNCTHQLTFTLKRQMALVNLYSTDEYVRRALVGELDIQNGKINPINAAQRDLGLMNTPARLDATKFKIDSVMHDIHCAFYILYPDEYETQKGVVDVKLHDGVLTSENMWNSEQGMTTFTPDNNSNLKVATKLKDPNKLFGIFINSISKIIPPTK